MIFLAFLTIMTKGAQAYQVGVLDRIFPKYIEETSAAGIDESKWPVNQFQMADANSLIGLNLESKEGSELEIELKTVQLNSVISLSTVLDSPETNGKRNTIIRYTVQPGDALSFIASDFGVTVNSIIWANRLRNSNSISPGQELIIPPVSGIIHTVTKSDTVTGIAKKYRGDSEKIIEFNALPKDGSLQIGQEIIVPDGKIATAEITIATQISRFSRLPNLGDFFILPTTGYNWGVIHGRNGVDIANKCGESIYAAAGGVVVGAKQNGWNGGAGKYIKISHPNGTETFYAHLSKLIANVGETVQKGQLIGLMGATGKVTGCHLHFEVHGAKNPLAR